MVAAAFVRHSIKSALDRSERMNPRRAVGVIAKLRDVNRPANSIILSRMLASTDKQAQQANSHNSQSKTSPSASA